jgi:hypothetical protein
MLMFLPKPRVFMPGKTSLSNKSGDFTKNSS